MPAPSKELRTKKPESVGKRAYAITMQSMALLRLDTILEKLAFSSSLVMSTFFWYFCRIQITLSYFQVKTLSSRLHRQEGKAAMEDLSTIVIRQYEALTTPKDLQVLK
ncbi:hypothetical protein Fot_42208 [Forsythia ovata]|uniref:Uncharacterized protein n=1 Tax=Forsythia ovata TaxID=205694 RepID=A0ABD1RKI2_9LAMI